MANNINALELSRSLIKCLSVTPDDGGAQIILRNVLTDLGFECTIKTFSEKTHRTLIIFMRELATPPRTFASPGIQMWFLLVMKVVGQKIHLARK